MLSRAVFFACCAIVLALVIGQIAPAWIAARQDAAPPVAIASAETKPASVLSDRQVSLRTGPGGHVIADGLVNDRPVTFLVDTGATLVVLNEESARRLGFNPSRSDFTQLTRTASGAVLVAPIRLSEIRIDNILVRDVPAVIVPGEMLDGNLLGMSFLNRLRKFEFQGDRLVLTQ